MVLESVLLRGLPTRTKEFVKQLPPFPPQDLALKTAGSGDAEPLRQSRLFSRGTTHNEALTSFCSSSSSFPWSLVVSPE